MRREFGFPFRDIYICDDSAAMLSPRDYQEFVLPYNRCYKEHFGGHYMVHCDGPADHLIPLWAKLGADRFWNFSYETSRQKMAEHFGGKAVLVGNINWQKIAYGAPDDVYADTLNALEIFAPYGGYIVSTPNIPPGAPVENTNAMHRAVLDYQAGASS